MNIVSPAPECISQSICPQSCCSAVEAASAALTYASTFLQQRPSTPQRFPIFNGHEIYIAGIDEPFPSTGSTHWDVVSQRVEYTVHSEVPG